MGNAAASERRLWWIFFVLGMGTLLPWNFFITPVAYWQDKLSTDNSTSTGNTTSPKQNIYQEFWAASLGLTTMLTNFLMCLLTSILMGKISKSIRFYVPMIGIGACFGVCAVMAQMESSEWVTAFFASTLALTIVITVFCAIFQSSLFGLGAEIGGKCLAAIMAGQGAGGVFACVIDLISKLAIPGELSLAACMYFVIAVVFMIISVGMFYILQRTSAYQDVDQMIEIDKFDMQKKSFINDHEDSNENSEIKKKQDHENHENHEETAFGAIKRVVWPFHLVLILTFTMTLSVFPGVVAGYQSVNHDSKNKFYDQGFYTTIFVFLNFNLFDFIGRSLGGPMTNPDSKLNFIKQDQPFRLIMLSLIRFLMIPIFFKSIPNDSEEERGIFGSNDAIFILTMTIMSLTNGLFSSIAMIYGPKTAPEHLREQIGGYLGTTLVFGLFLGALLGIPFVKLAKVF